MKIGPALNLVSEVPASQSPADIAATRRLDGMENRLFLDPLLRAEYPKDVIEYYQSITDFAFIKDEDLKAISEKIDFLGVNYYEQHVTRAIAGDNRRDAAFTYPGDALQPAWGSTHTALRQIRIRKRHF